MLLPALRQTPTTAHNVFWTATVLQSCYMFRPGRTIIRRNAWHLKYKRLRSYIKSYCRASSSYYKVSLYVTTPTNNVHKVPHHQWRPTIPHATNKDQQRSPRTTQRYSIKILILAVPCSKCTASTLLTRKPEIAHQTSYPHLYTVINDSGIATQLSSQPLQMSVRTTDPQKLYSLHEQWSDRKVETWHRSKNKVSSKQPPPPASCQSLKCHSRPKLKSEDFLLSSRCCRKQPVYSELRQLN
jgi:hypothetical protein